MTRMQRRMWGDRPDRSRLAPCRLDWPWRRGGGDVKVVNGMRRGRGRQSHCWRKAAVVSIRFSRRWGRRENGVGGAGRMNSLRKGAQQNIRRPGWRRRSDRRSETGGAKWLAEGREARPQRRADGDGDGLVWSGVVCWRGGRGG